MEKRNLLMPKWKHCPICNRDVDPGLFDYHYQTELNILDTISQEYPQWKENREKIVWFYRNFVLLESEEL